MDLKKKRKKRKQTQTLHYRPTSLTSPSLCFFFLRRPVSFWPMSQCGPATRATHLHLSLLSPQLGRPHFSCALAAHQSPRGPLQQLASPATSSPLFLFFSLADSRAPPVRAISYLQHPLSPPLFRQQSRAAGRVPRRAPAPFLEDLNQCAVKPSFTPRPSIPFRFS
jgi:hypothetical protein